MHDVAHWPAGLETQRTCFVSLDSPCSEQAVIPMFSATLIEQCWVQGVEGASPMSISGMSPGLGGQHLLRTGSLAAVTSGHQHASLTSMVSHMLLSGSLHKCQQTSHPRRVPKNAKLLATLCCQKHVHVWHFSGSTGALGQRAALATQRLAWRWLCF